MAHGMNKTEQTDLLGGAVRCRCRIQTADYKAGGLQAS